MKDIVDSRGGVKPIAVRANNLDYSKLGILMV
jgi:hypothetical protein